MGVQTIIALSTRGTNITAMVVTNASTTTIVMTIVAMLQRPRLIHVLFNAIAEVAITTIVAVLSVAITTINTTTPTQATSTTCKTQSLL